MTEVAAPVSRQERIVALDVLRGLAVLGILLMNVQSFGMVMSAYLNPTANDRLGGADFWAWVFTHTFSDLKFMAIFSALFGAGIVLMTERAEARGGAVASLHYRRQLGLLAIGLAHAHLIWYGDILVSYALCGMVLLWFRKLHPRWLLALGVASIFVAFALSMAAGLSVRFWPPEEMAAQAVEWAPPPEMLQEEIEAYRGGWSLQQPVRMREAWFLETFVFAFYMGWRVAGLMLIGMALFKLGILSARCSDRFYRRGLWIGLGAGLPIIVAGIAWNLSAGFSLEASMFQGAMFNYVGSLGVAFAYVCGVMLAVRRGWLGALQTRLAATGRMALTNYIAQSLVCTWIFYGHGLGLFEKVGRVEQLGIVALVWALQLAWSPWWLERFRFGPLEWAWRSVVYLRVQPLRRVTPERRSRPRGHDAR